MTYSEIKEVATKFDYEFPVIADDGEGNQLVIDEGSEHVFLDDEYIESHYFKVFHYLPEGVKITKYLDFGAIIEVNLNLES